MCKTSVIITTHNYGKYLASCIESVINQTVKPKEIIVINDASTDDTDAIASKYNNYIEYKNVSYSNAQKSRNHGVSLASGEYLLFLDADDYLNENFLKVMQSAIELSDNHRVAYCDRNNFGDEAIIESLHLQSYMECPKFDIDRLRNYNYISISSLIKKSNFVPFDERLNRFQDWDLWLSVLSDNDQAIHVPNAMLNVRFHGNNKTCKENYFIERLKVLIKHKIINTFNTVGSQSATTFDNTMIALSKAIHSSEIIALLRNKYINAQLFLVGDSAKASQNSEDVVDMISNLECLLQKNIGNDKFYNMKNYIMANDIFYVDNLFLDLGHNEPNYSSIETEQEIMQYNSLAQIKGIALNNLAFKILLGNFSRESNINNSRLRQKIWFLLNKHLLWRFNKSKKSIVKI